MDDAELSEERDRPTPRERLEDMADCYEQMAEEDRGSPEECRANAAAIRAVLSRVKDLECSAGCVPMAEYDESRAREAKTLERYAVACQTIHDIEVREARLREAAEPLLDLCENRDGSGYSPWREAISGLRAALASGETVKTVPVPPEVFERSTAEEMRALASGESREPASAGPAEEPATIKESLIVDRHARDCGCDEPGGLLCRRAHPEDPDWCPVHGWTFEACCGADKRAGEPGK